MLLTKMSMNLPDDEVQTLKALAERHGVTMTEVIRRSLATYKFFTDAVDNDAKILIRDKDDSVKEIVRL